MFRIKKYSALLLALLLVVSAFPVLSGQTTGIKKSSFERTRSSAEENYPFSENYPSLDKLYTWYDELERKHPDIVDKMKIGESYEGRNIWALKISDNVKKNEKEPAVMIDGNLHAREWSGSQVASYYLWRLATDYDTNKTVHWLIDHREIYVAPMVNPDGYYYDGNGDLGESEMWRKNRNSSTPTDAVGVDLNRNWDAAWDQGNSNPSSNVYHGESPFSEPETYHLKEFILSKDIDSYHNLHSHYGTLLIPWGYTGDPSPHDGWYREMASDMTSMTSYLGDESKEYNYGQPKGEIGYSAPGGAYDWVYNATGAISLTFEIYTGGSFYPSVGFIMDINRDVYDSLVYQARVANSDLGTGETNLSPPEPYVVRGTVSDKTTGESIEGMTVTVKNQDTGENLTVKTDSNGYYEFNFATLTEKGYDQSDNFTLIAGEKKKEFKVDDTWGKSVDMTLDSLNSIEVRPKDITITAGETQKFNVTAYGENGNEICEVTEKVEWSENINKSTWNGNLLTAKTAGEWTITANYKGLEDSVKMTVKPSEVETVKISPSRETTILSGETLQLSAKALDEYGNIITEKDKDFRWDGADEEGVFNKSTPGDHDVIAEYKGVLSEPITIVMKRTDPEIVVNEFSVDSPDNGSDLKISVSAKIGNSGTAPGAINLTSDGKNLDSWNLDKGETINIDETYELKEEGEYTLQLGDERHTVTLEKSKSDKGSTPGLTGPVLLVGLIISATIYFQVNDRS